MPVYEYRGVNASGKSLKGHIDAPNATEARARLRKEGTFVTEIHESQAGASGKGPGNIQIRKGVSSQDIAIMTRQLATLIASGIPLVESLTALVEQVENVHLKRALSDVREKVNEGSNVAQAMKAHPKVFSNLYVNMIHAGEASGALEIVLNRLSDFYENQTRLKGKITAAMAYPAVMLVVGAVALLLIFTLVIPKLVKLYEDLKQALPLPTAILIGISNFLVSYWYLVFILAFVAAFGIRAYLKTESGGKKFDAFKLRMPIFGSLFRMVAIARFSNTLSTLLASGVPILTAMEIVKNIVDNRVLSQIIENVRSNVSEGDSIAEPLRRSGEFPPLVTHMIAIGEKTGELEAMLEKVSETYNNQVDAKVSTLTALLEPIMIVVMAVLIGFVVFSVMLPIFQMNDAIR